jgi:outer membrane protein OmpA-like peptidoglycan-associated protein
MDWRTNILLYKKKVEKKMNVKTALICIGAALGAAAFGTVTQGCTFSASASAGTRATIVGKEKISVTADRPVVVEKKERKAKVVGKKIEITEKVMFDTGKATIKAESNELLNDVADVMEENASIKKVRIEGHTDSDGTNKFNKKLSQDRADSVMAFLVDAGIDKDRMEAVGYGEEKPISDNDTEDGKEKNRRVEFNILEQGN